jgi:hypothetical protein
MNPSGAGRFIADSWYSDQPLPEAYTHTAAGRLRATGGVVAKNVDHTAIDTYLAAVDVPGAIENTSRAGRELGGLRGAYLEGMAESLRVMWDLALEILQRGPTVSYKRCVQASTGQSPTPSEPGSKRERVAELLALQGYPSMSADELLAAVDAWRQERIVPKKSIGLIAEACIAEFNEGARQHIVPYLPTVLHDVPRANIQFLPIENAWFSGSMNYIGRARNPDGSPQFEATYEINASLEISVPEFFHLVSHEVVPGHVMNFALIHALNADGRLGFESTVLTMNTRGAALSEGIANNAILMAHDVLAVEDLPDPDLQIGTLLALLQDDAKNQSSYLTWQEDRPVDEVRATLRREFLCSEERADKLSGDWGRHPLMGRMYLPAYRAGTEKVAELRRQHPPEAVLPALYCALGLVDLVTVDQVLEEPSD